MMMMMMPPRFCLPTLSSLILVAIPLFTYLTAASPPSTTNPPQNPTNLPLPSFNSSTNLTTNLTALPPGANCRLSPSWSTPSFNALDCLENLENMWIHRVIGDEEERFEFLTYGVQQRTGLMAVRVPMKWVYRSCALAIEMVETFPPKVLMPYPARYPASDVGTWGAISAAALGVYKYCLMEHAEEGMPKFTGWSQVGANRGIGVFLWDRASYANEEYNKEWDMGVVNGSVTAMPTAALAGFNATATAMAVAEGEGDDLVLDTGPDDTTLVDTS